MIKPLASSFSVDGPYSPLTLTHYSLSYSYYSDNINIRIDVGLMYKEEFKSVISGSYNLLGDSLNTFLTNHPLFTLDDIDFISTNRLQEIITANSLKV